MRMQLSPQAEELLGQSDLVIITERVDDVALLIGQMITMGLPEVLDRHIPRHWKQRGLSWGWTAVIWLAHILTEGDHRKVAVEVYLQRSQFELLKNPWVIYDGASQYSVEQKGCPQDAPACIQ